jgi:hypothetical protein
MVQTITLSADGFLRILLPGGGEITVDGSYGQVYYRLRPRNGRKPGRLLTEPLDCQGLTHLGVDRDGDGNVTGIELIP